MMIKDVALDPLKRSQTPVHYCMCVDPQQRRKHPMAVIKHLLGEVREASRTVKRYEVESSSGEHVFLIGFNVGRGDEYEYWTLSGRGVQYSSAEEALAALEAESLFPLPTGEK